MKLFYVSMAVFICLLVTACSKDSHKEYDTGEVSVAAPDISTTFDQDLRYADADKNPENDEMASKELSSNADKKTDRQEHEIKAEVDLSAYFDGLTGTAVFLDKSGNYTVYNTAVSEQRASPCSTFKIISTLAALELGVVTPSQSVIAWDGTKWSFESWNKDLTITEAFQSSCVWYYRKLIDKIGKDDMSDFVEKLDYGNNDTSQWEGSGFNGIPLIDGFWLESSLLISPREQVDVMYQIFEGKTEINESNIDEIKKMMYKENEELNFKLYGKTGSGRGGWFVGFFEWEGDNTYFAVYLNEQKGVNGPKAQEITNNIIQGYFSRASGV